MAPTSYRTIAAQSEALYKEKGSKFLAFAFPVENEDDVKRKLELLRKKYFDARHHCYAYCVGKTHRNVRANDDGEPNHSAGDPILGQIRSKDLTDILIVVVRYFGGVKLGVGGLIAAYRKASELALDNSHIVEKELQLVYKLIYSSIETPFVMKLIKDFEVKIITQAFGETYMLTVEVKQKFAAHIMEKILLRQKMGGQVSIEAV